MISKLNMWYIIENVYSRVTSFLPKAPQSNLKCKSYEPTKLQYSTKRNLKINDLILIVTNTYSYKML
jgi:hypothetical protein